MRSHFVGLADRCHLQGSLSATEFPDLFQQRNGHTQMRAWQSNGRERTPSNLSNLGGEALASSRT